VQVVTRYAGSAAAAARINERTNAGIDVLYSETFGGYNPGGPPTANWLGPAGAPLQPQQLTVVDDPQQGRALQVCSRAFAVPTEMCSRAFPCSVSCPHPPGAVKRP
jgi:hypothetical protein